MRKFCTVLVALAMCICLCSPAFAADTDSLTSLLDGVDVGSMSDSERSSVLEGLDLEGAMAHYKERITYIVKRYLLTDFEVRGGWDEVLNAIRPYVEQYYK